MCTTLRAVGLEADVTTDQKTMRQLTGSTHGLRAMITNNYRDTPDNGAVVVLVFDSTADAGRYRVSLSRLTAEWNHLPPPTAQLPAGGGIDSTAAAIAKQLLHPPRFSSIAGGTIAAVYADISTSLSLVPGDLTDDGSSRHDNATALLEAIGEHG